MTLRKPNSLYTNHANDLSYIHAAWDEMVERGLVEIPDGEIGTMFTQGVRLFKEEYDAEFYHIKSEDPRLVSYTWCLEFKTGEDLTAFLLRHSAVAQETLKKRPQGDTAFYYAPYVPLQVVGAQDMQAPGLSLQTRYGTVDIMSKMVVYNDKKRF